MVISNWPESVVTVKRGCIVWCMANESRQSDPKPALYYEKINREILSAIPKDARQILDVGCAAGLMGAAIKKMMPSAIVHGIERTPSARVKASEQLDHVFDTDLNVALPPLGSLYDCIVCADILEHLIDPWTTLQELSKVLTPAGVLVASIPNLRYYKVLRDLLWRGRFTYREYGVMDATHLRFFTIYEMKKLFQGAGFELVESRPIGRGGNLVIHVLSKLFGGTFTEMQAPQYLLVGRLRR